MNYIFNFLDKIPTWKVLRKKYTNKFYVSKKYIYNIYYIYKNILYLYTVFI